MPNIDDLSISVKSNVTSATNSIDKLITKLGALSASLGQVNTSGFSAMASGIRQITSATKSDSVKSITELANSIKKFGHQGTNKAVSNIPYVAQSIQLLANTVNGVNTDAVSGITNIAKSISRLGYATADKAITNIPQINTQLQGLIGTVNSLSSSANGISYLSQLSSALTKLGGKTGTTAVNNIPNLTKALNQMIATLSKAPQVSYNVIQLVNSMANLASQGSKVGTASNSLYNGFMRFGKGADHARKKSFSLASAIGKLYASYFLLFRLFRGIGKGIDLASSLTEVQNVVDVSFGQYRDKIEDFASTSIQDYGMSELTAKQIASRYQAMGGAIGFAQGEMADMSITLTKLAADMASFYNVEQAAVAEDLEAIFTQQTRPLRQYGIDLTQASMESWLLTKGIETNIAALTQQEKVLLNYNYVLEKTGMAQGDFARTQDTWANQLRILRQQFEALSAIIGQNFIYALKPLVSALNTVMGKLIQFARVVSDSLGTIFGWKYEVSGGGLLNNEIENVEDFSAGLSGASDKAKKLKQQLQGFDELNVLTTNTPSSGGGGGGGGVSDLPQASYGQWVPTDDDEGFFSSELDTLYKLGEYISTSLTDQLRSIDWQKVYQGAKDFGFGLADFLNGLISPDLFGATGRTIAGALNTAIYSSLAFGTEFDFDEFGSSIAQGVNEFFDEFDFVAFGQNIVTWAKGLKDTLIVAIAEIEWGDVLAGIGDILSSLDAETIAVLFGFGVLKTLFKNGLFGALGSGLRTMTTLPAGLVSGITTTASLIATSFKSAIIGAFAGWNIAKYLIFEYDEEISDFFENLGFDVYENLDEALEAEKERRKHELEIFENAGMEAPERGKGVLGGVAYQAQLEIAKDINLQSAFADLGQETSKAYLKADETLKLFGVDTKKLGNITAESFKQIANGNGIFETMSTALPEYADVITNGVSNRFNQMSDNVTTAITWFAEGALGSKANNALTNFASKNVNTTSAVNSAYQLMANGITGSMIRVEDGSIQSTKRTKDGVLAELANMRNGSNSTLDTLNRDTTNKFAAIKNNAIARLVGLSTGATNQFASVNTGATRGLAGLGTTVSNAMAKAKAAITNESWYTPGVNLVGGLQQGITNQWNVGLTTKVLGLANILTSTLKKGFGIHSPSRIWRDEIGSYLTQGLEVGILGEENHLLTSIASMGSRLTNTMSGALTLATPSSLSSNYDFGVTSTMAHNFSADGSMSSNIAQGVRDGVYSAQAEQNALLREQNNLLLQILNKEGISMDDVYSGVVNRNRDNINRTGLNPMMAY